MNRDVAKVLLEVINAKLKSIEVNDLEARLFEMEKTAKAMQDGTFARQPDARFE